MADIARSPPARGARVAFLFPGQGSQQIGMGVELLETSSAAKRVFRQADEILGWSVTDLCRRGPLEKLLKTENLQPALLTVSLAALRALGQAVELSPTAALGHSLGEYAGLVAGGAIDFADALAVVRRRGELMAEAVASGEGAMVAVIGLGAEVVESICCQVAECAGEVLAPANLNAPEQVVVSGHARAIERAAPRLKKAGARGLIPLKVSAPFHCCLMQKAADRLRVVLAAVAISPPRFAVLSNVTGQPHGDPESIRRLLVEQVVRPVRWIDCVRWTLEAGVDRFLEIGPGRVLAGLLRRIDPTARVLGVCDPRSVARVGDFVRREVAA